MWRRWTVMFRMKLNLHYQLKLQLHNSPYPSKLGPVCQVINMHVYIASPRSWYSKNAVCWVQKLSKDISSGWAESIISRFAVVLNLRTISCWALLLSMIPLQSWLPWTNSAVNKICSALFWSFIRLIMKVYDVYHTVRLAHRNRNLLPNQSCCC